MRKSWDYRVLGLERVGKRRRRQIDRERRGYPNPVHRARAFERALEGGRRTYEEVAAEFGVTKAAVCQYLAVVKRLPADVVQVVESERDPARLRKLSMKSLLRIARMAEGDQGRKSALAVLLGHDAAENLGRTGETCAR